MSRSQKSESTGLPPSDLVTTRARLEAVCDDVRARGWFAFDTEFVGEDQYKPELCLIQVATDEHCYLIDPMDGLDVAPIWDVVCDPNVRVILHAAAEDLGVCWKHTGRIPQHVFDVQVAAGLVGYGYPTGLTRLAKLTVGAKIHKSQTLTDWRKRPLSTEQIVYAVADVAYLPAIRRHLMQELDALGRRSWAEEECARLSDPRQFEPNDQQKLRRLKGTGSMTAKELAVADALLDLRDALAEEYNRPPRTILRDHLLCEIARRGWSDPKKIRSLRGMNLGMAAVRRVAEAVDAAKRLPREAWPEPTSSEPAPDEDVLVTLLTAVLRDHCQHHQIAYGLLASKEEIRLVVRHLAGDTAAPPPQLLAGWRHEAVGTLLKGILTGKRSVRVLRLDGTSRLEIDA